MLESNLRSYFWWKAQVSKLSRSLKKTGGFSKGQKNNHSTSTTKQPSSTGSTFGTNDKGKSTGGMELSAALKRKDAQRGGGRFGGPPTKRRRVRGGGVIGSSVTGSIATPTAQGSGFEAATGANPEAFEEDAEKLAKV
jgi:DNA excision repair protein ERCC-4